MGNYTSEILPSGLKFEGDGENFTLSFGPNKLFLSKRDISRMDGIAHPSKVHGTCKVSSVEDQMEASNFEKAINETAEKKDGYFNNPVNNTTGKEPFNY
jgi:hypothetical protein